MRIYRRIAAKSIFLTKDEIAYIESMARPMEVENG